MSASNSENVSSSFYLLDKRIQRWIWDNGWDELKDIQEFSIPLILEGQKDVILAAATASGKTEAAFLPILTRMLQESEIGCVLYISPLKALINDQFGRLELLCEKLEIPITPWHGDIGATKKKKFLKSSKGIVLITPESLEAMLMLRGHQIPSIFQNLRYIVIDELHAFIGLERGKQLQSLMHRLDVSLERTTPRIALSATLGDMSKAAEFLRPKSAVQVEIIESKSNKQEIRMGVKGYVKPTLLSVLILLFKLLLEKKGQDANIEFKKDTLPNTHTMREHLFKTFRNNNNLIFPNSRKNVEFYTDDLNEKSKQAGIESPFVIHHGNLNKIIRAETEAALKSKKAVTAICTNTLELGIDIGDIKTVGQIGCAPSVASLRQRLGRSGRRKGESAILWGYAIENEISTDSHLSDLLRENLIQFVAQINLLVRGWYEMPEIKNLHLSTFIQQLLSLIAQYQGIRVIDAWKILCDETFNNILKEDFIVLLRKLGALGIVMQESSGMLLHGVTGEKIVNDYKFYAAFKDEPEYRIVHEHKTLGTLPYVPNFDNEKEHHIIFAGKRWRICNVDVYKKVVDVVPAKNKLIPDFFGEGISVDDRVRQEMYDILSTTNPSPFLDRIASLLLTEARRNFHNLELNTNRRTIIEEHDDILLFLWAGSKITHTIALILSSYDIDVINNLYKKQFCFFISIHNEDKDNVLVAMKHFVDAYNQGTFNEIDLVSRVPDFLKQQEKWDYLLPEPLLSKNYASSMLDVDGAIKTIKELLNSQIGKIC